MASSTGILSYLTFFPSFIFNIFFLFLVHEYFICHFCFNKFRDPSSLRSHFPHCHKKTLTKKNDETIRVPQLNKTDREMLHSKHVYFLNLYFSFSSSVKITSIK